MNEEDKKLIKARIITLYQEVEKTRHQKYSDERFKKNRIDCKTQEALIKKLGYDPRKNNVAQAVKRNRVKA